ncbi:protein of unknown function [Tepidibacter aestuarii]|nr:protein of unknown function [Tepidibacter aestuarii]
MKTLDKVVPIDEGLFVSWMPYP